MPHRDKSEAIKQAIYSALNATQGHKHGYQQAITSALNATLGHKRNYHQAVTSVLMPHRDTSMAINKLLLRLLCHTGTQAWLSISYYFGSKCHTGTQA